MLLCYQLCWFMLLTINVDKLVYTCGRCNMYGELLWNYSYLLERYGRNIITTNDDWWDDWLFYGTKQDNWKIYSYNVLVSRGKIKYCDVDQVIKHFTGSNFLPLTCMWENLSN